MSAQRLFAKSAALIVVDVQERLCAAMEPAALERMVRRTCAAIAGAKALGIPVVVTEQYPKGLGSTMAQVKAATPGFAPVEKIRFSAALPEVLGQLGNRSQVLIAGMETHVCVFQTVRDLKDASLQPYLLVDAVLSRTEVDREVGLDLCRAAGAEVTTVEAALFDMLEKAGTPEFKAVSVAVK
jgi:nicotinamidase-related amidase